MTRIILLVTALLFSHSSWAQHAVELRNLWVVPRVHVEFEGYSISFTVKDIDRALQLLEETGDSTFGYTADLDTATEYTVWLYPGYNTEYRDKLQPLVQMGIGAYLLSVGHAYITSPKSKELESVIMDAAPLIDGESATDVKFYDPRNGKLLFSGRMATGMFNKDIGID